ncbi:hypothetical protein HMN09_00017600 [Mycena chlorophos]|uniref:Ricin B lectin domain-containing protein n=1 Tax=Mycena chlorophos TaxID=658473 RepID=A0A8H6WM27_MYCCL|nr:hypothetical protein HMN09_00017600 [Mycena chlorophos]
MRASTTLLTLLGASASIAAPIMRRTFTVLDPAATAEAQVRDNTATRAFSAVPIKTSSGLCLSVDPNSGDFRENLTPVSTVECNGSANQTWDVITAGVHNNVPGQALIVSALTQACLNFDPRRAAGNQVLLFSCGGRADGGGSVTNSQQFAFSGGAGPFPLVPLNGNNQTCITVTNGLLDDTSCNPATASGNELFTIDGSGSSSDASSTDAASTTDVASTTDAVSTTDAATTTAAATTTTAAAQSVSLTTVTLVATAVAEAQVRDDTATRAASATAIKTSDGQCLQAISGTGDFRNNLVPVEVAACDGSAEQQWDIITAGVHNNVPGTALIVSSSIEGCLNFDPRRAAGNQVLLFSCGGRADGGGSVTNSQLFTFNGDLTNFALEPTNQAGTCLVNNNGFLDQTSCNTASPDASQLFSASGSSGSDAAVSATTAVDIAVTTTAAPSATTEAASTFSLTTVTLVPTAVAEAQVRDNTATRAASAAAIKTSNGQCLQAIPGTGDFRNNLVPVEAADCNGSAEQQWDVITAGVHNNVPGTALIVSTLIEGCLNFDPRRAPGNQVLLFSCGGRGDGGGSVTNSQLFTFGGSLDNIALAPTNQAGTCLDVNSNGFLDQSSCNTASPASTQQFTIG